VEVRRSTRRIGCDRKRIADAVEMIRKMACSGISSADVVDFIGESRRTAEAHFREVTGRSIHEEIDEIRFAKVFELLKNPRQSLDSLPDLCGFKTGAALRKAFSLRTGMSMRDWRKGVQS
jgi:transcriptional regulator GlxA family with amidase domain